MLDKENYKTKVIVRSIIWLNMKIKNAKFK